MRAKRPVSELCSIRRGSRSDGSSYDGRRQDLFDDAARLACPICDGVPIMLGEAARKIAD